MGVTSDGRVREWNETWALAVVFGLASVPWTYAVVAADVPLWPSFVASATYYAVGGEGVDALARALAANLSGLAYAVATLAAVEALGGGLVALSLVVGGFMFLASLHSFVGPLSFAPGAFLGFATLFSVEAAGATVLVGGLAGVTVATVVSMLFGAVAGVVTDELRSAAT